MKMGEDRKRYLNEYKKMYLKRIPLDIKREDYPIIKEAAAKDEESVNSYIRKAITWYMCTENGSDIHYCEPEDFIAAIINNEDLLYRKFIPALFESDVDVAQLICKLLDGVDLGRVAKSRLEKYQDDIKLNRTLMKLWEAKKHGNYTIDNVPEWVFTFVSRDDILSTLEKLLKYSENFYDYLKIGGKIHFTLLGYENLILFLEQSKIITTATKEKWMNEIHPHYSDMFG